MENTYLKLKQPLINPTIPIVYMLVPYPEQLSPLITLKFHYLGYNVSINLNRRPSHTDGLKIIDRTKIFKRKGHGVFKLYTLTYALLNTPFQHIINYHTKAPKEKALKEYEIKKLLTTKISYIKNLDFYLEHFDILHSILFLIHDLVTIAFESNFSIPIMTIQQTVIDTLSKVELTAILPEISFERYVLETDKIKLTNTNEIMLPQELLVVITLLTDLVYFNDLLMVHSFKIVGQDWIIEFISPYYHKFVYKEEKV